MEIHVNANYTANNVIRFRGIVTNPEIKAIMERLDDYINSNGARQTGELITTTRIIYLESRTSDIEIFVPIDRVIPSTSEFEYRPLFSLNDCIMTRHKGNPRLMPVTYTKLYHKVTDMGLEVVQPFYNVFKGEVCDLWDMDELEADVYVVKEGANF